MAELDHTLLQSKTFKVYGQPNKRFREIVRIVAYLLKGYAPHVAWMLYYCGI